MYRVNLLPRKVLLVHDEVFAQTAIDNNADPRILLSAIQIAEERFVKPAIGKELYYDYRDKKNRVVTADNKAALEALINADNAGDAVVLEVGQIVNAIEFVTDEWYLQLWNEYLWKLAAECVVYIASPTNFSRFTASGEEVNNPKTIDFNGKGSNATSVELKDMQWKLNKMLQDRIDPLQAAMHEWICDYKVHFSLYKKCPCDEKKEDGVSYLRKTPWVHGIYGRNRRECDDE